MAAGSTFAKLLIFLFLFESQLQEGKGSEEKCEGQGQGSGCIKPKVICYFTNRSTNRTGKSTYHVSDIDTDLCTNIVYSFAVLNPKTLLMEFSNPEIDIDQRLYEQVTALKSKSKDLKVSIALGGWMDSGESSKYSNMINDGSSRTNFVHNVVRFLLRYDFDGLDLDWEYPKCWQGNCSSGPVSDRHNFANLIVELWKAFSFYDLLLSATVSAERTIDIQAYHVDTFAKYLDWIGVMTYDYVSTTGGKTGHQSPYMGPHPNTVDSIQFWLDHGVPSSKIIMGIPLYGRSFTLKDVSVHGIGAPATIGHPAEYTQEAGYIAFFEFCNGWTYRTDPGVGSYAFKDDQWVSYNDVTVIHEKAHYAKQFNLGGVLAWAIDLDDFRGEFCNQGKYPLLSALKNAL